MNYSEKKAREVVRRGARVICRTREGGSVRGTVRRTTGISRFDVVTLVFDDSRFNTENAKDGHSRYLYVDALIKCLAE